MRKEKICSDNKNQTIGLLKFEIKGLQDSKLKLKKKKELLDDHLKATEMNSKNNLQKIWNLEEELKLCKKGMHEIACESEKFEVLNRNYIMETKIFEKTIQELESRLLSEQISRNDSREIYVSGGQGVDENFSGDKILDLENQVANLKIENE